MSEKKNVQFVVVRGGKRKDTGQRWRTSTYVSIPVHPARSLSRRPRRLNHAVVTCAAAQIGQEEDDEEEVEPPSPARSRCPPSRLITFTQICR